ncbi:MAG: Ig-like domain-containing protein [Pirellulaceae bacterium]
MKKRIGNMFRQSSGPRTRANRLRALQMESLEGRRLLAGDLVQHNYMIAEDVNVDFIVSPSDALTIINEINRRGTNSAAGEGESTGVVGKLDVNNDGILSGADVLGVINRLNGEGENGFLIDYRHEITDLSGAPITSAAVDTSFRINVFMRDARDIPADPDPALFGVYSGGVDLGVTNLDLVTYQMATDFFSGVTFGPEFLNSQGANEGGGIQIAGGAQAQISDGQIFTLDSGSGVVTFEFDWDNSIGAGNTIITLRDPTPVGADPLTFAEIGNATATAISSSSLGRTSQYNGQGVIGLDLDGITFDAGTTGFTLSQVTTEYFNEVRSFLDRSRSPNPAGELLFYSIVLRAETPGTVTFTPNGPERPGSENLLYGDRTPIPNSMVNFGAPFSLTIVADPNAPVAVADTIAAQEDVPRLILASELLPNDTVTAPRTKSLVSINTIPGVTQGTLNGNTYTSPSNFSGQDFLTYTMADSTGSESSATITINVAAVNDAPVAADDNFTVDEDSTGNVLSGILSNDNGGPGETGDTLRISAVGTTSNGGTVTIAANGQSVTYSPVAGFVGTETFQYTVSDQGNLTDTATVTVEVEPLTLPRARTDRPTVQEDSLDNPINVLTNDSPNVGAQVTLESFTQPTNGTVTLVDNGTPADKTDDSFTYTPNANFNGTDTFTYTISDTQAGSQPSTATVTITVTDVNDPVILVNDTANGTEDTPLTIPFATLLSNDSPGTGETTSQTLTITGVTATSAGGDVDISGTNVVYTPTANFNGQFVFTYDASDNGTPISSGTAQVTVTVAAVNDNPVANPDTATTNEDIMLEILASTLTANDSRGPADESGQTLSVTGVSPTSAAGGTVTLVGTTINYTPAQDFNGSDSFTYTLSDGAGGTATGTVAVTVTAVNDAPNANADVVVAFKDNVATIQVVLANDNPGPANEAAQTLSVTAVNATAETNGTVRLNADGTITYTPNTGFVGTASFEYTLSDSGSGVAPNQNTATGTVTVNVQEFQPSSVGGIVWVDETHDGVIDDAERRLGGVSVTLTGTSLGQTIQPQTLMTLADGSYSFDGLGPGSYTVSYAPPKYMIDNTEVPNSYDVSVVEPGGVNDNDNNFAVLGLDASYGRMLDQLASRYVIADPTLAYNGAYFALNAQNQMLWGANLDGYSGVQFSEAVLNGNDLLLTVVDASNSVYTARLAQGQGYLMVQADSGGALIRVLGSQANFPNWQRVNLASPPVEAASTYLDAVDAIFAQEGWDQGPMN